MQQSDTLNPENFVCVLPVHCAISLFLVKIQATVEGSCVRIKDLKCYDLLSLLWTAGPGDGELAGVAEGKAFYNTFIFSISLTQGRKRIPFQSDHKENE